jgi:hypothetical protein
MFSTPTRCLTIFAQDPSVKRAGRIVRTQVTIPNEDLDPGPRGYRVQVIDYDTTTQTLYKPFQLGNTDPFRNKKDAELLHNPGFHAQNVYAIVMRTLARFEFALGRRVNWSFPGHQLLVAPHAFADANAFYSSRDRGLLFGYFPKGGTKAAKPDDMVFTCLSHDIVAHETTHALVDGLRARYLYPSSPDQAAFHEGFADVVAILSVLSLEDVARATLDLKEAGAPHRVSRTIAKSDLTLDALRQSDLLGLAEQMGAQLSGIRGDALRRSVALKPSPDYLKSQEYDEPHQRGEIFVAAFLNAFLLIWAQRIERLGEITPGQVDREKVAEEGASVAEYMLTAAIRGLDYAPPTDLSFSDFVSAMVTADAELHPAETRYQFRKLVRESFAAYGIKPASREGQGEPGAWGPPQESAERPLQYDNVHVESLRQDPDEVYRFIWENRAVLRLDEQAFTRVISVRPCTRVGIDGLILRETVAEYTQTLTIRAAELRHFGIRKPSSMKNDQEITLYGGSALIFDSAGRLKYDIRNRIGQSRRQSDRLRYLWESGYFSAQTDESSRPFAAIHRRRALRWFSRLEETGSIGGG